MAIVVDLTRLEAEGRVTPELAALMRARSRETMVSLAINLLLSFGILAAAGGLIFWLADALAVAMAGLGFALVGAVVLTRGRAAMQFFGRAALLIGTGTLMGGATVELLSKFPDTAAVALMLGGAVIAGLAALGFVRWRSTEGFVLGAICAAGVAMHLFGVGYWLDTAGPGAWAARVVLLYATGLMALVGWFLDVRLITALAILPFAEIAGAQTFYFFGGYVFSAPESTLTILQMGLSLALALWLAGRGTAHRARHLLIFAMMSFVVANLAALVGSLWGDVVGLHAWGPRYGDFITDGAYRSEDWAAYAAAREAFRSGALEISANTYTMLWAAALVGLIIWSAMTLRRGLFNASVVFAALHGYTQMFESFGDEPFAYVIGGLLAIPLAWGVRRLNEWLQQQDEL